jgi:DNA-binding NtrC family response regulator
MAEARRTLTTRIVQGAHAKLDLERATIQVVRGPDRGQNHELGLDSVLIGTSRRCDLVLHDPTVSAVHAEILVADHGFRIRDRESRNGLRLGGWPIHEAPLGPGMRLSLGETELRIRAGQGTQSFDLAPPGTAAGLVARSVKMRAVAAMLERFAASDLPLLIEGETGSGKEVAAQAVHELGPRAAGPFVIADCAALTASLFAAELFGHERGAFTGADVARPGLVEHAAGGTLFLDEIGELPLEQQVALLGVLERREVRRVGSARPIPVDVRVIAATNRNLAEEVRAGRFRQDLYYRLAVGRVRLPPLRERPEDLVVLAQRFSDEHAVAIPGEVLQAFLRHDWPGNVRELRNAIALLAVRPEALELGARSRGRFDAEDGSGLLPLSEVRLRTRDQLERDYLQEALSRAQGNLTRAAELAGITRVRMMQLAAKHRLRARDLRESIEGADDGEDALPGDRR